MKEPLLNIEIEGVRKLRSGKVREILDLGENLLIVATDRISAFDVIMPNGIPDKGAILTQISNFWFRKLSHIIQNHLVSTDPDDFPPAVRDAPQASLLLGRSVVVKKAQVLPIECVVRGYLAGSGWKDYRATGATSGVSLPPGLTIGSRLEEPIFAPATKAHTGHDENISIADAAKMVGVDIAERLAETSKRLYTSARDYAETNGLIVADTKFEFGLHDGDLLLIDEALTPDSSRFWDANMYKPGESPVNFDKQIVRDYLETLDWNKQAPGPVLPEDVVLRTREKYLEAFHRLTGMEFSARS